MNSNSQTTFDLYPVLFDSNSTYYQFFNNPDVQKALHAPEVEWFGCIPGAGRRRRKLEEALLPGQLLLAHDEPQSVVPYVAELLDDAGIRVLIYNGDRDLSTNAQGSEVLLDDMHWSGAKGWRTATRGLWMVRDQVAGYAKSYKGLDFVVVYNSGHLVPNNQPIPALDLITRFVTNDKYLDIELPSFHSAAKGVKHGQSRVHRHVHGGHRLRMVVIAFVFFCFGVVSTSFLKNRKHQYSRISDTENGELGMTLTT